MTPEAELGGELAVVGRPTPLVVVRPQRRVQRHTVEHIMDVSPFVQILDVLVPHMANQLVPGNPSGGGVTYSGSFRTLGSPCMNAFSPSANVPSDVVDARICSVMLTDGKLWRWATALNLVDVRILRTRARNIWPWPCIGCLSPSSAETGERRSPVHVSPRPTQSKRFRIPCFHRRRSFVSPPLPSGCSLFFLL